MIAAALVFGSAILIVFVAAMILDHLEFRRDWAEWQADHPEPPSRLDRMDRGEDPWMP